MILFLVALKTTDQIRLSINNAQLGMELGSGHVTILSEVIGKSSLHMKLDTVMRIDYSLTTTKYRILYGQFILLIRFVFLKELSLIVEAFQV